MYVALALSGLIMKTDSVRHPRDKAYIKRAMLGFWKLIFNHSNEDWKINVFMPSPFVFLALMQIDTFMREDLV